MISTGLSDAQIHSASLSGHFLRRHRFRHQAATSLLPEGSLGLLPLQFSWSSHPTHCDHPRSAALARETLSRPELLQRPHPFRRRAEVGHPNCHSYSNIHVDPCSGVDTLPEDTWHKCIGQRVKCQLHRPKSLKLLRSRVEFFQSFLRCQAWEGLRKRLLLPRKHPLMEGAKHAEAGGLIGLSRHQTSTFVSIQRYGKNMNKQEEIGRY